VLRWAADTAYPMTWDPPERFPECLLELQSRLQTTDPALASELLADSGSLSAELEDRVQGVQQRAATLQGAVAIAATVAFAGGGLVLDADTIPDHGWRVAFAVGLALLVALLVLAGFRALGASSRAFAFVPPSDERIFERSELSGPEAQSRRAAYLLQAYGHNNEVAALKVGYLKAAAMWFRLALVALVGLTVALAVYVSSR
jgi:MFS family permease